MKKIFFSKAIAILLLVMLLLGMFAASVSAAVNNPPEDPVDEPRSLTIHKYIVPDNYLNGKSYDHDGRELTGINNPENTAGVEPLDGIEFIVYPAYTVLEKGSEPGFIAVLDSSGTSTGYGYFLNDADFTMTTGDAVPGSGSATVTATDGLGDGIYVIAEQVSTIVQKPVIPFLVSVPMRNPAYDGITEFDEYFYDVHVYPKNEAPNITKGILVSGLVVPEASFKVGDTVTWQIDAKVPENFDAMETLKFYDTLDEALDYEVGTVAIKVDNTALDAGDFNVAYAPGTREIEISFTATGLAKLAAAQGETIAITFDTVLTSLALDPTRGGIYVGVNAKEAGKVENHAEMEYRDINGFLVSGQGTAQAAIIKLCSITVNKVDTSGGPLTGAKFRIATSEQNAKDEKYLQIDVDGVLLDVGESGYKVAPVDADFLTITTAIGAGGKAIGTFEGLFYEVGDEISYWLVEIEAPVGYNKLRAPFEVVLDDTGNTLENDNYNVTVDVVNKNGFELPITGGVGIVMFSVLGLTLMGGSVLLLVFHSRRKRKASAE